MTPCTRETVRRVPRRPGRRRPRDLFRGPAAAGQTLAPSHPCGGPSAGAMLSLVGTGLTPRRRPRDCVSHGNRLRSLLSQALTPRGLPCRAVQHVVCVTCDTRLPQQAGTRSSANCKRCAFCVSTLRLPNGHFDPRRHEKTSERTQELLGGMRPTRASTRVQLLKP